MSVEAISHPITTSKPQDPNAVAAWQEAVSQAKDAGIEWERPKDDKRSAQEIIDDSPLLKNLGNQSHVKDMLRDRVGDFEHDPDAAYRGAQVLEHIEKFNGSGNIQAGKNVDNGRVDGFTKSGEARHDTEAGRLQDFGKYGFSNLKGELKPPSSVGDDQQAREDAENVGIIWVRPEEDRRSAQEIIDDNPLLKHLGNQSGVKDRLKERVGDFESNPDAAYRAAQVLDRVTQFDEIGKTQSGEDVFNTSVDGFTKSGEARHGTEAGRLQDFGKYGFAQLPELKKTDEISSYKDFLKANPDADEASKKVAKYAAILEENYDAVIGKTGSDGYLTADALHEYKQKHSQLSDEVKQALDFWSQPGAFELLDTAKNPLSQNPDGQVGKGDVSAWMKSAMPKDGPSVMALLSTIADKNLLSKVDTGKFDKDIFEHPENYSAEQKAAALQELQTARQLIVDGAAAGMWKDDKSKVTIANQVRSHPDPQKLLDDVDKHAALLQKDPEVAKYLNENGASELQKLVDGNKGLKEALETTYNDDIKSGKVLDTLWDTKTKDGKTDQQTILAEFYATAQTFQGALGLKKPGDIQSAVKNSSHNEELQDFYKDILASGDRLKELLKTHSFEEAASAFSMEVALYNAALDPEFSGKFDAQLNDNFTTITQENVFKNASFDDIKQAFGVNGGDELDEEKVKKLIEEISKDNPELLLNKDGTVATPDQVLAGFRGNWDMFRQGTKTLDKLERLDDLDPNGSAKGAYDRGVLHGVSGLFLAGMTIARGANSGGKFTDRQLVDITAGSIQTATVLTEGGLKGYQQYLGEAINKGENTVAGLKDGTPSSDLLKKVEDNVKDSKNYKNIAKNFEEAAKGLGGLVGVAAGAYAIFDGVQAIRKGDTLSGGLSITAGSLGVMAGLASAVEGGLGILGQTFARIPIFAGALGFVAAGFAALAALIPGLVEEGRQEKRVGDFADVLSGHLTKYEIDGVENGDIWDIPDSEWPGGNDSGLS
jgi:hypothetical protein